MTDKNLFDELVKRGVIENSTAQKVLRDAELGNRQPEDLIYERRLAPEEAVAKVKSEMLGAPYRKVDAASINEALFKIIPKETSQTYRVIPIERTQDMFVVGMFRPDDVRAQEALRFIAKQQKINLGVYVVTLSDLNAVWRRYSPYKSEVESALTELNLRPSEEEQVVVLEEGGSAEDAPVIKIVASTLRQAVETKASDIHIEPQRNRLRIRFRVDGELKEAATLPLALAQSIISRVKVLARLKLDERRIPQDGRFRTIIFGRDIDYRVATFPTPSGEKVAIRVLDPTTGLKSFEELGLNEYNFKILDQGVHQPYGMIIISGPTGSGKTTTLYAIMQKINSDKVNIVSLEDPVEYLMEGINQSQVRPEIGYDFASGLRQILRQDPDVVMVGEIRDTETANLAINAALTGHVMLSTLHTNNAIGVIPRLIDLGVPAYLLPSSLNLMLAQRLVAALCPNCKKPIPAPDEVQESVAKALEALPANARKNINFKTPYSVYHAAPSPDCKICNGKGTAGRIALFEVFKITRELSELISAGFTESKLYDEAKRQGMVTLRQDGIIKALEGKVLIEEVLRETEE